MSIDDSPEGKEGPELHPGSHGKGVGNNVELSTAPLPFSARLVQTSVSAEKLVARWRQVVRICLILLTPN
jgi:hypothetical protein